MAFTLYNSALQDFFDGTQDWDTDSHYCMLLTSAYTPSLSHSTVVDVVTSEVAEGDYNPQDMSGEIVTVGGDVVTCDASDVSFNDPVTITTAKYAVIAVGTVGAKSNSDLLVGYVDLGTVSVTAGPFVVSWDDTSGVFQILRSGGLASVTTRDGTVLVFERIASEDTNHVTFLAPQHEFPFIKDYAGTFTDTELSTDTSLKSPERRGLYTHESRVANDYPVKASLQLAGEVIVRAMFDLAYSTTATTFVDMGSDTASPTTENYLYRIRMESSTTVNYFAERGAEATNNISVSWNVPGRLEVGREYILELRRTAAGVSTMWLNGYQLQQATDGSQVAGVVLNSDGSVSGTTPDGGSNAVLASEGLATTGACDLYFASVSNALSGSPTASTFASGKGVDYSAAEKDFLFRDDFATKAADPNIVVLLRPSSGGLVDDAGTITAWDASGSVGKLINDVYWTRPNGGDWQQDADASTLLQGDLTINVLFMSNGTYASALVEKYRAGETAADNYQYRLRLNSNSTVEYIHEAATVANYNATWTCTTLTTNEIREFRLVRETDGGGGCGVRVYERLWGNSTWTQLTVASVSGTGSTGVGTLEASFTTVPGGGTAANFVVPDTFHYREVAVYDAIKDP